MKVLIVDDSDLLLSRLTNALNKAIENISITQAHTCKEAMELFLPSHPDTIILDIALPDGSGISLLQKFKNEDPGVHVIIFTNYPTDEFKKSCLDLGADLFIDKKNISKLIDTFSNKH